MLQSQNPMTVSQQDQKSISRILQKVSQIQPQQSQPSYSSQIPIQQSQFTSMAKIQVQQHQFNQQQPQQQQQQVPQNPYMNSEIPQQAQPKDSRFMVSNQSQNQQNINNPYITPVPGQQQQQQQQIPSQYGQQQPQQIPSQYGQQQMPSQYGQQQMPSQYGQQQQQQPQQMPSQYGQQQPQQIPSQYGQQQQQQQQPVQIPSQQVPQQVPQQIPQSYDCDNDLRAKFLRLQQEALQKQSGIREGGQGSGGSSGNRSVVIGNVKKIVQDSISELDYNNYQQALSNIQSALQQLEAV